MPKTSKRVYMLEDDSDDRYITESALQELGIEVNLVFFSNSNELLNTLLTAPKPSLVLIDYNSLPDNGLEVLKKIKSDPLLYELPVVILSDNHYNRYKNDCYAHGASSFIRKPDNVNETASKIATFFKYWLEVAEV